MHRSNVGSADASAPQGPWSIRSWQTTSYGSSPAEESAVARGGPVVEQMHFTPGIPLSATLTAAYRF